MDTTAMKRYITANTGERDTTTLNDAIDIATGIVLNKLYPFAPEVTEVPERYSDVVARVAIYILNKRGADGQLLHNENGIYRTYESADIPSSLLRELTPHAGVPV